MDCGEQNFASYVQKSATKESFFLQSNLKYFLKNFFNGGCCLSIGFKLPFFELAIKFKNNNYNDDNDDNKNSRNKAGVAKKKKLFKHVDVLLLCI